MPPNRDFILGEFRRTLDERFRLSVPSEIATPLTADGTDCILAKERPGAISLWNAKNWSDRLNANVDLVQSKMLAGRLEGRLADVQQLGRLLSTRHREIQLAGRGRLVVPEGFREFLGVEAGGDVLLIGAAVCIEIWKPEEWIQYLNERMPQFGKLLDELAG
jgi:MraZ protein